MKKIYTFKPEKMVLFVKPYTAFLFSIILVLQATSAYSQTPGLITNVTATSGRTYTMSQLIAGTTIYTDRTYQATTVPAFLNNAPFIKTPNDDKANTATSLLSFDLTQSATVYVAYDPRATALPAWLGTWQKLASQVGVNDSKISYMELYSKAYPAGKVTIGGNLASPAAGAQNMYFVAALAQTTGLITNVTATTGRTYTLSKLIAGTTIYTDRTYQATTVPVFLNNAHFIKTPNDDKASTATSLLSFDLTQNATVYVAYDPRATALPAWLSSWQKLASQIGINDSKISYMQLYSKAFPAGKVTLGGNLASPAAGAQNMYFVAALAAAQFTLTVTISGSGTVTKNPNQATYAAGSSVTLTATPAAGNVFKGWSGAATGTVNPLTIIMNANKSVTASFAAGTAPAISVTPSKIYDNDVIGGAVGIKRKVLVKNTGSAVLTVSSINTSGTNINQFVLSGLPAFPRNVNAGDTFSFSVAFNPSSTGLKTASVNINSNAPSKPVVSIPVRGLGTPGLGGANEPSLQALLNLFEVQVNVGDDNASTNVINSNTTLQKAPLLGEEVSGQKFQKAGAGNVTITPLAVFGPTNANPIVAAGWYKSGNVSSKLELFSVSNSPVSNGQTVNVNYTGTLSFDPASNSFGFYSRWPFFANRHLYSEDNLNTFSGSIPHHVRVYRNKKNGVFIANSYIIAFEEHTAGFDYQDILLIVNNVKPAAAASQPVSNASLFTDQTPAISASRIVPPAISANENFKIFPNPVRNTFAIEFPEKHQGKASIQIIDLPGKIYPINKTRLTGNSPVMKVDISKLSLNSGMYFLRIVTEGKAKIIKLIVQ